MSSKLTKLSSENVTAGFSGNVLSDDNYNSIISHLLMNDVDVNASFVGVELTSSFDLGNGTTGTITRDGNTQLINGITLTIRQLTDKMPVYPNEEMMAYSNSKAVKFDKAASSYQLLNSSGAVVNPGYYSVDDASGEIRWGSVQTADFFMLSNMTFIDTQTITITRNKRGRIESITSKDNKFI